MQAWGPWGPSFVPQGRPKARIIPPWGQRSVEGASVEAVIYLFGASELALDRFAALECRAACTGGLRPQAPVIDRQEE